MCGASLDDWANGGSIEVFVHMVKRFIVQWGVGFISWNWYGIEVQIMLDCSRKEKCLRQIGVVGVKLARRTHCPKWGLRSSSPLRAVAIQTIDIFIRGQYLQYLDFPS